MTISGSLPNIFNRKKDKFMLCLKFRIYTILQLLASGNLLGLFHFHILLATISIILYIQMYINFYTLYKGDRIVFLKVLVIWIS